MMLHSDLNEKTLLELADSMAAAASSFNAHGYDTFIQARDTFKEFLHTVIEQFNK